MALGTSDKLEDLHPDQFKDLKKQLVEAVDRELPTIELNTPDQETAIDQLILDVFQQSGIEISDKSRQALLQAVKNDLTGYGPIQPLLEDQGVSEVMVNGPDLVYIEKDGILYETGVVFDDDDHVMLPCIAVRSVPTVAVTVEFDEVKWCNNFGGVQSEDRFVENDGSVWRVFQNGNRTDTYAYLAIKEA